MTTHAHRHEHAHGFDDAHTNEVADFVANAIAGRTRVLEVGCGRGHVAKALASRGFQVTALDLQLHDVVDAPAVTFVERDFLADDHAPFDAAFDAIVFTSSLHHIAPLDAAVERAQRLLAPGGLLVADEFDVEAPDPVTLAWYYDTQELLVAAGLYPAERLDDPHHDIVARWQHAHAHDPRLHTGSEMRTAIGERFSIVELSRREYLYRYIWHGLPAGEQGRRVAATVAAMERRRIAQYLMTPVGLRIVAQRLAE